MLMNILHLYQGNNRHHISLSSPVDRKPTKDDDCSEMLKQDLASLSFG